MMGLLCSASFFSENDGNAWKCQIRVSEENGSSRGGVGERSGYPQNHLRLPIML